MISGVRASSIRMLSTLVDDREIERALDLFAARGLHVVPQVVEAELAVRPVRHVAGVVLLPGLRARAVGIHRRRDMPDGHAEMLEDRPGELGVARDEVVVRRHDVRVQAVQPGHVDRRIAGDRLALAGGLLGDPPLVENHAGDELGRRTGGGSVRASRPLGRGRTPRAGGRRASSRLCGERGGQGCARGAVRRRGRRSPARAG